MMHAYSKDCRCMHCLVRMPAKPCAKRVVCMLPDGHAGSCTSALTYLRVGVQAVKHDAKALLRRLGS